MKQTHFPHGWDEAKVRRVLGYYETQTEGEVVAEDEAAFEDPREPSSKYLTS